MWETAPLYVAFVGATELVPLLPTQPVSLTAGLLFGPGRAAGQALATRGVLRDGQRQRYRGTDNEGADGEDVAAETRGAGNRRAD